MLKQLRIRNFTVFQEADIRFTEGLNVIVGDNATGKSHLLKLAYVLNKAFELEAFPGKDELERNVAESLVNVFRPDKLGRLVTRAQGRGRCDLYADSFERDSISCSFSTNSTTKVHLESFELKMADTSAIFIPPKEVLSIFPGFAALYRNREVEFDETYADLCDQLAAPLFKGPRLASVTSLVGPMEEALEGSIRLERGRFYLQAPGRGKLEVPLLAEGYRKIGQLAYLLLNGSLMKNGMLLWDEPESNLNPRLIRNVARFICHMAAFGIQVVLATHSMFLLRELDMLAKENEQLPMLCTALLRDDEGVVTANQASDMEDLPYIAALEEEAAQGDRYLAMLGSD